MNPESVKDASNTLADQFFIFRQNRMFFSILGLQ